MDKRLTAAGYAIKPHFESGSFPVALYVTLNGIELPDSRRHLPSPGPGCSGLGDAAFLAAEAEAFDACKFFAMQHWNQTVLVPESAARRVAAMVTTYPAGPAPFPAGHCEVCGDNFTVRFTGKPDRFACDRHADLIGAGEPGHYGTANDSEIGFDVLPPADRSLDNAVLSNALIALDRKDDVIDALKVEVERLAEEFEWRAARVGASAVRGDFQRCAGDARALLRRLGLALAAGLLASGLWAAPAPAGPQAPARAPRQVTRPVSSISVKVMPHASFQGRFRAAGAAWAITTADADSCTAWVDGGAAGIEAAELAALKACRAAVDRAVDGAHAAAEKGGAK